MNGDRVTINSLPVASSYQSVATIYGLADQVIDELIVIASKHLLQDFLLQIIESDNLRIKRLIIKGLPDDTNRQAWMNSVSSGCQCLSSGVVIDEAIISDVHIGMALRADNCKVHRLITNRTSGDPWQISGNDCEINNHDAVNVLEVFPYELQHSDVGQFFPKTKGDTLTNSSANNIQLIKGWHKWEHQSPQGILATDGHFENCSVTNSKLVGVHAEHGVSFYNAENCLIDGIETNGLVRAEGNNEIVNIKPPRIIMYDEPKTTKKQTPYEIAMMQMGVTEIAGAQNEQRIVEYFKATTYHASNDEVPWCAAVHNWIHREAGVAYTKSAAALSWLDWGVKINKPELGCTIILDRGKGKGHVGFYVGEDQDSYKILGGNQDNAYKVSQFSKNEGRGWYFRKPKRGWHSTSAWTDFARSLAAIGGTGYAGNEAIKQEPVKAESIAEPETTTTSRATESVCPPAKPCEFEVPDGYKLIPQEFWFGALVVGALFTMTFLYTFWERIKKIRDYGI